jgi:LL-diaminopimelate aminotransferase
VRTSHALDNLPPYLFAEIDRKRDEMIAQGIDVISLGIGDPDIPTPKHIVDAMEKAIRKPENHRYPDYAGSPAFRAACASYYKRRFGVDLDPDREVLALIGSKEGIAHLFLAFCDPGDYVLVPGIGYPVYSGGGVLTNVNSYYMPMSAENGFLADFESTPDDVLAKAKIMFLCYPSNPTAATATPEYFDRAIAFCKEHDLLLAHDAAYIDLCYDGYRAPSILERPGAKDVCIEFYSLSKTFNMTGWRIAFAAGNETAITALGTVKNNLDSGQFTAVQEAAIAALTGPLDCIDEMCALYTKRRDLIVEALRAIGMEVEAPKASIYIWAKVPDGYTSAEFTEKVLVDAHVIVAAGTSYGPYGEGYVRISLTTPDDRILEAVSRIKASL